MHYTYRYILIIIIINSFFQGFASTFFRTFDKSRDCNTQCSSKTQSHGTLAFKALHCGLTHYHIILVMNATMQKISIVELEAYGAQCIALQHCALNLDTIADNFLKSTTRVQRETCFISASIVPGHKRYSKALSSVPNTQGFFLNAE